MTFSFIKMPGLTSQKEAQNKINEGKAYGPTGLSYYVKPGHPDEVDPKTGEKKLHKTNGKKKVTKGKIEDEPTTDNGETAKMNPKVSANEANMHDLKYDADIHSDGSMSVSKINDKIHLIGKSYHSSKDHVKVAKKMGMVATKHTKTMGGTRTVLSKEETQNEDKNKELGLDKKGLIPGIVLRDNRPKHLRGKHIEKIPAGDEKAKADLKKRGLLYKKEETQNEDVRIVHRRRLGKPKKFKKVMPHLSGVNPPKPLQPQFNSKDWDLDEISSLDETSFDDFINNLTEEEFKNLKESYTSWRADRAEKKFKSKKQHEKDKARLNKYTAALDRMNNKNLKIAIKGAQPGHTTGGQKVNADTEYQGGKTMNEMSKIRKALLDVVEKKSHGHTDAREKWKDKFKGAGAEQMKKDLEDNPKDNPIWNKEKESHDDAEKAGRAGPGKSPARGGADNLKGETKIIPPGTKMKDPGAPKTKIDPNVDKGKPSTNEQREEETFMKSKDNLSNIIDAYNSMNNDQ